MCTSLTFQTSDFYFGRNLDLEYNFGEKIVITPRQYPFIFKFAGTLSEHYAIIGTAQISDGCPLYAEAVNEKGLCLAALNFPGNAVYAEAPESGKTNLAPFELFGFLLGTCATVKEAEEKLKAVCITHTAFKDGYPVAPLHWHIADKDRSLVLECIKDGMHLYENPVGVLTNNPPFPFQLTNLQNYMHLTSNPPENRFASALKLAPYGQGMGTIGLPGDASPASRFVRAAFCKWNSELPSGEEASVTQFFHILDNVAMVAGSVRTPENKFDRTTYSSCINASRGIYYYKTYNNNQISAVSMHKTDLDGCASVVFEQVNRQQICYQN